MRLLRRAARLTPLSRFWYSVETVCRHATARRLLNLFLVESEYRLRRTKLLGRPYILVIDPLNVCKLRCPLCSTGLLRQGRARQLMSWETFVDAIDRLAPWAFKVNLFNWSEPLLHPRIFDMIRYAADRNLGTALSSSLSLELDDDAVERLVSSGLELLCVSVDGATQSVYETYRREGDLAVVLRNVERVLRRRRESGRRWPIVEWQFIVMRHNEQELEGAAARAQQMRIDRFRAIPVSIPFDSPDREDLRRQWFPAHRLDESREPDPNACPFLYRYFVVNPDGGVSPCCRVYGERTDFAKLSDVPVGQLWNNDSYSSARAHYRAGATVARATVCDRCPAYQKRAAIPQNAEVPAKLPVPQGAGIAALRRTP